MKKYLYLTKPEWADAWVNGGKIPLNLATAYKRMDRDGIYTPDEGIIYETTHDVDAIDPRYLQFGETFKDCSVGGIYVNGVLVVPPVSGSRYEDDGVILSLCNVRDDEIKKRLNKQVGVEILDVYKLKEVIDSQLKVNSDAKSCSYTSGHIRNHFTKSEKDSWQNEFRLFWSIQGPVEVELPSGIASVIP
ncbi:MULTISPECIES: hypothetical protein [Serratia]|uniref:hypothetical protein n=1 Tax=Serratia TaxID=613 RepID=UPI0021780CE9|nr:hypothetical protein [Serratia marcescens]CAI1583531.1 Uncharacterised protein [Serratia marcescens]